MNNILPLSFVVLLTVGVLLLYSCGENCHNSYFDYSLGIRMSLQDRISGESLIGAYGKRYDEDAGIFIEDSKGNSISTVILDDVINFSLEVENYVETDEEIELLFYLDLPPWEEYPRRDVDTLKFITKVTANHGECITRRFGYLKFLYNGVVCYEGDPSTFRARDYLIGQK